MEPLTTIPLDTLDWHPVFQLRQHARTLSTNVLSPAHRLPVMLCTVRLHAVTVLLWKGAHI